MTLTLIPETTRCAQILDLVAKTPPGTSVALTTQSGDPLFACTRMSQFAPIVSASVPESFAMQSFKALLDAFAFGLPVSGLITSVVQLLSTFQRLPPENAGRAYWAALRDAQGAPPPPWRAAVRDHLFGYNLQDQ